MSAGPALWQAIMYVVLAFWAAFLLIEPLPSRKARNWSCLVVVVVGIALMVVIMKWGPK